ncbi:hypothetical protein EYF80_065108 [Liparis tanakae]|uniref:Uncharacterized protein n=1 Tax=Liparis tanakae TaxID=230148 RepID=A0A4Z2E768_9TELE|nr:hypothetical protein EYF80_065108 [Liparis tanakae]
MIPKLTQKCFILTNKCTKVSACKFRFPVERQKAQKAQQEQLASIFQLPRPPKEFKVLDASLQAGVVFHRADGEDASLKGDFNRMTNWTRPGSVFSRRDRTVQPHMKYQSAPRTGRYTSDRMDWTFLMWLMTEREQ